MQLLTTVHTVAKNNNTLCINKSSTPLTMFTTFNNPCICTVENVKITRRVTLVCPSRI